MGFFSRFSKRVEAINKGEAPLESLAEEYYVDELEGLQEDAMAEWRNLAQTIVVNSVKATNYSVERAFILIDFNAVTPSFDIFFQEAGKVIYWNELKASASQSKIEKELLPQAKEVVDYLNDTFIKAKLTTIGYAQLQFEAATGAWFSHIIWSDSKAYQLAKPEMLKNWFTAIQTVAPTRSLASDSQLPW